MKKPEKLFLLINEINDRFVDEAKDKAEKPVSVRLESRMPIKEIIAFAACFAVLAVGIFAFVKFKLNSQIDPQPVDNDSSNQSFELNSGIELEYTEQDKELQTILKELVANAEEIDGMFNDLSISGEKYKFKLGEYSEIEYYLVPDNTRTANGLFTVPQSYDEMEQLISQYFSPQAAVFYMENVSSGSAAESPSDGIFHIDFSGHRVPMFIEINGRMYVDPSNRGYQGMGIDCDTARVIRKTDKSMEFSYWGYDYTALSYEGGDKYSERNGALVYGDGAWKLHYFYDEGFMPEMPAEYTEQDLELQNILKSLEPGDDVSKLFSVNSLGGSGERYIFRLPDNDPPDSTATYINVSGLQPKINHPKSINELRQRMLEYFTAEATDKYMWNVCNGTMTANPDGTYTVTLDKDLNYPTYIEIDGKMFYWEESVGSGSGIPYFNTAKVTEQTNDTIIFSYTYAGMADFYRTDERLVYERGGWKRDPFYQPESDNPPEESNRLSADDQELQGILSGMLDEARDIDGMFYKMSAHGEEYGFKYINTNGVPNIYYLVTSGLGTEPNGLFAFPQNRGEMESLLQKHFSERAVKTYMSEFSTGSMTKNSDGTYAVETDSGHLTAFIEINGKLFYCPNDLTRELDFDPNTAKVISKTDKTITFNFTPINDWNDNEGALVYENGGWKLNHFGRDGFIPEYPTEYTAEDEELQKILEELAPNYTISGWFNTAGEYSDAYYFEFPELDSDYITFYYKLPTGTFANGKEKYPQSYDELEALLLKYFTQETVDYYMERVCRGTKTEISNENFSYSKGSYSVTIDRQITDTVPRIIEIDGEMYYEVFEKSGSGSPNYDTAKVISKTDNSIDFSYVQNEFGYYETSEKIKFERGGWKFD